VQPAEQTQWRVPRRFGPDERIDERLVRETAAEPRVEGRASARRDGLV